MIANDRPGARAQTAADLCIGDCNNDTEVLGNEITAGLNIVAGTGDYTSCSPADANGDGEVFGSEVTLAIRNLAGGCFYQLTPSGRTHTTIVQRGDVIDISEGRAAGRTRLHSFDRFDVAPGQVVNFRLTEATDDVIVVVNSKQSIIDGTVNVIRDGAVGGGLYLVNPHGFVIGADAVMNTGTLTVNAETAAVASSLITAAGEHLEDIIAELPAGFGLMGDGENWISGTLNAAGEIRVSGGPLTIRGSALTGVVYATSDPDFSDVSVATNQCGQCGLMSFYSSADINFYGTANCACTRDDYPSIPEIPQPAPTPPITDSGCSNSGGSIWIGIFPIPTDYCAGSGTLTLGH